MMNTSLRTVIALLLTISTVDVIAQSNSLQLFAEWKQMVYKFPDYGVRLAALESGDYVMGSSVPIDVDVNYRGNEPQVFVSTPRFKSGTPVTFGVVSKDMGGPRVDAYPNYFSQSSQGKNCDGITSVFRVAIDTCQRLWILDTGKIGKRQLCNSKLVGINLYTNKTIVSYQIPTEQLVMNTSQLVTLVVDVRNPRPLGTCSDTMIYIADNLGFGILVYNVGLQKSWRVQNKFTYPNPDAGTFNIAGQSFELMDGIVGIAATPPPKIYRPRVTNKERLLYFHALSSQTENKVPLYILDNSTLWNSNSSLNTDPRDFVEIGSRGTQSGPQAMDRNGNLFFGLMNETAIGCLDTSRPYNTYNIQRVAQDYKTLQFISGLKVVMNKMGKEELWVLSNRYQKVATNTLNTNEVNFRILYAPIEKLLGGNKCNPDNYINYNY